MSSASSSYPCCLVDIEDYQNTKEGSWGKEEIIVDSAGGYDYPYSRKCSQ
ncbi:MAG: hypothetical protein JSV82_08435 [Planctomycetota bacterium]|nr:MAG: hypothetical protein JSV82_08435 [Planctomycetota bacterium]